MSIFSYQGTNLVACYAFPWFLLWAKLSKELGDAIMFFAVAYPR
jgi:hypothetical protein